MEAKDLRSPLFVLAILVWTGTIAASLFWNLHHDRQQAMETAYAEAQANLNKDISFRRWATQHGGVYVPITATQKSVPWLSHVPGRDIVTTDGRQLTLLNPASMLRQMMDLYAADYGVRGRITGLKYLNPGNAPDDWERRQLESFVRGERKEVWEVTDIDGKPYLRYLRAMVMEPGCDKCHGILGYKTGDMRGATGLNLPLEPFLEQVAKTRIYLGVSHLVIWLMGLAGILWGVRLSARWASEREVVRRQLERHRDHLEELVAQRTGELQRTEARAEHILNSSADGLFGVDAGGSITFINPAACKLLGYRAADAVGRSAHALFHYRRADGSDYPACDCPTYGTLKHGQEIRVVDEVYWHADGHPIPVMYASHPIVEQDRITGVVTSFVDLTAQRAAEEAREQARQAAEWLARARRDFLANMSHEMRTPLHGILGFAQIGSRHAGDAARAARAFAQIQESGKRLLHVIDDVLDFSSIEAGKLTTVLAPMSVGRLIDEALALVRSAAEEKHIVLDCRRAADLPVSCLSDAQRLGQVLLNVLSNAVKFTEAGSVTLTVTHEAEKLMFRVSDTGIGIDTAHLGRLFNPFEQADSSATRRFGGTGLGLAISKQILTALGGDIVVSSRLGEGSIFEFFVPCLQPGVALEVPVLAAGIAHRPLDGIRILVAEDEPVIRAILAENLIEDGAQVTLAENGRLAVERVIAAGPGSFDIVLMDMHMPEMDGLEATRQLRDLVPALPIIAQTANALVEERERCLAAGMVAHIAKPIDHQALVDLILQHVAGATR